MESKKQAGQRQRRIRRDQSGTQSVQKRKAAERKNAAGYGTLKERSETNTAEAVSAREMRRKQALILAVFLVLGGAVFFTEYRENVRTVQEGIWRSDDSEETRQEEFSYETDDGRTGRVSLEVSGRALTQEEEFQVLEEARKEWEAVFLGENKTANEVCQDLELPDSLAEGKVTVSYRFNSYDYMDADGRVLTDDLPEEGVLTELTAEFVCGERSLLETRMLRLIPPDLSPEEAMNRQIRRAAAEEEAGTREQASFQLPETVDGHRIFWKKGLPKSGLLILLAGVPAALAYGRRDQEREKKRRKQRRQILRLEYPHMVEQFSMLLGSGMTVPGAWEQIVTTGLRLGENKTSPYLEEMQLSLREMKEGSGIGECLDRFGSRVGLTEYRRFSSILAQNLKKGTRDVREQLQTEAKSAMEARRTNAKRLGEEAGTKLLGPMMCMFVIVLAVVLYPALQSF